MEINLIPFHKLNKVQISELEKIIQNANIMQFIGTGNIWSHDHLVDLINYSREDSKKEIREYYYFGIVISNGELVGFLNVHPCPRFLNNGSCLQLQYGLSPEFQGYGYMSQSISKLLKLINGPLYIIVRWDNKKSISVAERQFHFVKKIYIKDQVYYVYQSNTTG
jgi:RimJ/RimL family protein N-acetyltransferase